MTHGSPLLSSIAASVDRERRRETEMWRRSRGAAPHGKQVTDLRSRLVDAPGGPQSLSLVSCVVKARRGLRDIQGYRTRGKAAQQPGM